ncbi:hypothetical protein KUTeg_008562 [Tegillarca granosa]|uniref:Transformation/transcription domain-associated protein n=1 Tax=Tegillarca granosa TaxID=220873 RepID=A0ABQ9F9H4_TEGGR|nr:hypothetical protein KUTeg_008562 [Tegillarca granosa]
MIKMATAMLPSPLSPNDAAAQLTTFKSYVALIADPTPGIVEKKLKAAQELSENFESVVLSPQYPQFLAEALKIFLKILDEGEPQFIAEQNLQQLRKLLLEIIHRIPTNEHLKKYVQQVFSLMFKLLKSENEENVLVCLRIIIELHKHFRPQMNEEIKDFLQFVKNIYKTIPSHLFKIFEPRTQVKVKDVTEINVDALLQETFTVTTIMTDKKNADNQSISYNIIPRGVLSLKVLAELPIIVVLMYQLYKPNVHQEVAEFIPLIMNTIILQPLPVHRQVKVFKLMSDKYEVFQLMSDKYMYEVFQLMSDKYEVFQLMSDNHEVFQLMSDNHEVFQLMSDNHEVFQLMSDNHEEQVQAHSQNMVKGLLGLLSHCPQEVAHLRKELLIAARHILATDLRNQFVHCIDKLFDENVLIGVGWTTHESLRPLAYSTLADLVHHVRQALPLTELSLAVNLFSKNVHDESLPSSIQTMSCKLLLNLVECIRAKSEQENGNGRELLMRMLEVFVLKFKTIAKVQLPQILQKWCPQNRFGVTPSQYNIYSVNDCRSLVKTLVCGVKTITWGIVSCKAAGVDTTIVQNKQFLPKEALVYIRLVKYALQALDIYTINVSSTGQAVIRPAVVQSVRTKEEKEVLEHFAGVYMVDRIHNNYALQIVANSFLANPTTSATFATILVDYLLARLEEMGCLNNLQSGLHRQHMKDLFVELCLTVPVRLSSLLPYLPMLMDPLVSALNGSQTLVSQGLRTLELCVDNLQPDFLYDHIQPVRAELMQALWRTLRNPVDNIAHVAFRVLGKFGGGNRKMLREPQKLNYNDKETAGPCITVYFQDCKTPVSMPVEKAIDAALTALKCSTTDNYVRRQAWELIKCFLVSVMNLEDDKQSLSYLFSHPRLVNDIVPVLAAAIKELRQTALPFMGGMVRQYTMISISQQCGPFPVGDKQSKLHGMDTQILIDALAVIMGHEEKELCKPGNLALVLILDTATTILGSKERACQLPLFDYLVDRMCALCYDRAWYAKCGGCLAIKFMYERMSLRWVLEHQFLFLKALLFVMMDLTKEVSSGAVDLAKHNLENMLVKCAQTIEPGNEELLSAQKKSFHEVTHELVRQITSPNTIVREQAMHSLEVLAKTTSKSITEIMEPHKEVLQDMIPPKKHLLRHQPANAQIGLMLLSLCEAEDAVLLKLPCYKSVTDLVPLRKSALPCHYISNRREKIFQVLYKALNSNSSELQEVAHNCMKKTHLKKWLEVAAISQKSGQNKANGQVVSQELKTCAAIINIFHMIPAASNKLIEPLVVVTLSGEKALFMEAGSPFREPLMKFLLRYPDNSIEQFLSETHLKDQQWTRLFEYILSHKDGKPLREVLENNPARLINIAFNQPLIVEGSLASTAAPTQELQYQIIKLISILTRYEEDWFSQHTQLDAVDYIHWKEPALLVKCLLNYFKFHNDDIELLFHILKCFTNRYIVQFQFVKDFLDNTVAATYSIEWKRKAFFKFEEIFHLASWQQEDKAMVFHSLLKAHAVEARSVVRQALEILTPAMPGRMEDGNGMLTHWTKKIIVEEGHTVAQLVHILQLVVRHFKVYYPVRHHLIPHMVNSLQRLGFTSSATIEHRKLAVDLAEVVIKWEVQRIKEDQEASAAEAAAQGPDLAQALTQNLPMKRTASVDSPQEAKRSRHSSGAVSPSSTRSQTDSTSKPIEKHYCDAVVNFLLRIACQVNETPGSPGELLSRRCVTLLKTALRPDVWPSTELKLAWFDKLLNTVENHQPNFNNICTALELLCFLLNILKKETILASFKPLQRGIAACMTCPNNKVIRGVHSLLSRLMSFFPTEPVTSNVASKYEELECLYACVSKVVYEGLTNYEKATTGSPSHLFSTLMILKAACMHNQCYIDRLITTFMKVLHKMAREHLTPTAPEASPVASELLILSLDLVKNRVGVMSIEMRKSFIGQILVGLIEKTTDSKVMKAITKMVEDWVKTKTAIAINQSPVIREKAILLVKLMQHVEKRFSEEQELNTQFLDLVNYIYRDESLCGTELTSKLEPAFLAGLRYTQPNIRQKFVEVFENSIPRRIFERLLYITCSQNWEAMGSHFWIKQCVELLMSVAVNGHSIQSTSSMNLLPSASGIVNLADSQDRVAFATVMKMKEEPMDVESLDSNKEEEEIDMELSGVSSDENIPKEPPKKDSQEPKQNLSTLLQRQAKFLDGCREVRTVSYLSSLSQLCHSNTDLTHIVWVDLYPRIWKVLSEKQQQMLGGELIPFMCSGSHVIQKDCHPSSIHTFLEGLSHCVPSVQIRPIVLKYLGKTHNLWHRACLQLEQMAFENSPSAPVKNRPGSEYEFEPVTSPQQETLDSLCELYSLLKEEDMWAGLWQKRSKYPETNTAIAYEQHGFFEQAQTAYEQAMTKARQDHNSGPASPSVLPEYRSWEEHWIRCSKELNQWDLLLEYANSKGNTNPHLVLESAWRVPNWALMKDALSQVELSCPKEMAWKVNLYRGYIAICHPEDHHLNMVTMIERMVEVSSNLAIKEWRRLPSIVSHIHVPLLQAAQQIMELQEAAQINQGLQPANITRSTSLHDMKAIVKTWRNRLPMISDDLSHWSDIFTWRQHHYQFIVNHYDSHAQQDPQNSNHSMLGVHASAQAIIHFGKIARKHNLTGVCLDSLSRIHTIPSVPIVDCFQKIRQQVKCYLQMSGALGKSELNEGLEVIESTNLKYFTKEMTAEFYALKGMFLAQIGRSDDANKAFSAAVQMHDTLVKAWALWGDYLETVFTREKIPQLLTCLVRNEGRLIMNLLSQVGHKSGELSSSQNKGNGTTNQTTATSTTTVATPTTTISAVSSPAVVSSVTSATSNPATPEAPTATTVPFLAFVVDNADSTQSSQGQGQSSQQQNKQGPLVQSDAGPIRAPAPMWRCSKIMHLQRELHPTILNSLEGIVDQMVWFRENWYEEVLRQLRQGLAKCYAVAFENRGAVAEATITPHTLNFVKKLVSTFGVGIENVSSVTTTFSSAASESLARRAQATAQDPVFQKMKSQFTTDFDFSVPGSTKLHNLINKLKKWIKILEAKTKLLPKCFLIEEKCRFLSNFSQHTAEVELPGEFLLPKHSHYYVRIARFMPRVEIVQKHNTAARRLYIRGHNGKVYPYLVVNDACLTESRREERVLQLLRMMNHFLTKQKETSRRLLYFTVPRVVAISPQMRLVEDNPASISLLDVYKQRCTKRGIEHDAPIARYYERLATVQARGSQASHQVLRDILKEVQTNMVPRGLLKEWALNTFITATDYWTFRKTLTVQLALMGFAEFVLHLTRMNPDMMYLHQDSGYLNISYFKFDIDDQSGDLDANRPVPFRLTPNIADFLSTTGVVGPLTASMVASARCLVQPQYKLASFLKAIFRDEYITWHKKKQEEVQPSTEPADMEGEQLISMELINYLATFDGAESRVSTLVAAANSHDNLCRMDPAWHPWL